MLRKRIPALLLLAGLAFAGGCLSPTEELPATPVSMSVLTSTPPVTNAIGTIPMATRAANLVTATPTVHPTATDTPAPAMSTPRSTATDTSTPAVPTPRSTATDIPTPALLPAPIPRHPAPDFALPDLEGNKLRLSDFRGQVVLINFWTTW